MSEASESRPAAPRQRRIAPWISALLAIVVVTLLATPFLLRGWLAQRLRAAAGLEVDIAAVEPLWRPLGVALGGVDFRVPGSPVPLLHVARLEVPWLEGRPRVIGALLRASAEARAAAQGGATAGVARVAVVREVDLVAPVVDADGSEVVLPDARLVRLAIEVGSGGALILSGLVDVAGGRLGGWLRHAPESAGATVTASARAQGIDLSRVTAAQRLGADAGIVDGRLRLRGRGLDGELRGRIAVQGFRGKGPGPSQVDLGRVELRGLGLDLASRTATVRLVGIRGGGVRLAPAPAPPAEEAGAGAAGWSFAARALELRDLLVQSAADPLPGVHVEMLAARQLGGPEGRFSLTAAPGSGGRLRARGEVDTRVPRFRADVDLQEIALGPWIEAFEPRLRVSSGRFGGRFEVWGPPGVQGRGELEVEELRVAAARSASSPGAAPAPSMAAPDGEILRLGGLDAELRGFTLSPLRVWLTNAEIEAPSLQLTRTAAGLEPFDLLGVGGATGEAARSPGDATEAEAVRREAVHAALAPLAALLGEAPPLSLPSIEVKASVRDGSLRFRDEQVSPPFTLAADRVEGGLSAWGGPPWGIVRADLTARLDQASPLLLRGEVGGPRLEVTGEVSDLRLASWSSYLTAALGYEAVAGTMDASVALTWQREVSAPTRLVLEGVSLKRGTGADRLEKILGMPLDRALDLMRDGSGRTELVLRLDGDAGQPALGLVAALPAALREAVPEAVTVPLFEGSELVGKAGAEHVRLAPLRFPPGESALPAEASQVLERLAVVLRWDADLVATLAGSAERAELASATAAGAGGAAAAHAPAPLAARRAEVVRERLVAGLGVAPERVRLAPSGTGEAAVRIELQPAEGAS